MIELFVPLVLSTLASLAIAVVSRSVEPRLGARMATIAIASVFLTALATLWVVALGFLAHDPQTGALFGWCRDSLGIHHGLPRGVGIPVVVAALWAFGRAVRVVHEWRRRRGHGDVGVRVLATAEPVAFVEPGRYGSVVVSTGMLEALEPVERRAMLAHEQSHVRHRHDLYLLIGKLATGLPVLAPLAAQQRHALERWADEDAARSVGDRSVVARAVARAALAAYDGPVPALSVLGADVPARVEALLRVPRGPAVAWPLAACGAMGVTLVSAAVQVHHLRAVLAAICPV